jgi:alkylated DNA repair dioxygenase AlkB
LAVRNEIDINVKLVDLPMQTISIAGAELYYQPDFLPPEDASELFNALLLKCAWSRRSGMFGHAVPRDEAYYGDPETKYTYSRREYQPLPWITELSALRSRVEQATPVEAYGNLISTGYNAVLCNLYRNGNDSVGWHADAEPEMGPIIASVSLGAARLFRLQRKNLSSRKNATVEFEKQLPNGSLLIMAGETQKNFRHEVPKEPNVLTPRINLTFRYVQQK